MDRRKVYPGQQVLDEDVLLTNRYGLIGLARLAAIVLGDGPVIKGLEIAPGAGLTVTIARGEIYVLAAIDATSYGALAPDAHTGLKQGILADPATLAVPAPATPGQSRNHLIQVQYQQVDTDDVLLPFYDAANPDIPYSGPNDDGTSSTTTRAERAVVQVKSGAAATTGSQVTPAPDAGWTALYVVTVAQGQSSITVANIFTPLGVPFLRRDLTQINRPANAVAFRSGHIS